MSLVFEELEPVLGFRLRGSTSTSKEMLHIYRGWNVMQGSKCHWFPVSIVRGKRKTS